MSMIMNICGFLIATHQYPDPTLEYFYRQYYGCYIRTVERSTPTLHSPLEIAMIVPQQQHWWPVFTIDQAQSPSFKRIIEQGIKPGIILPDQHFSFRQYFKLKKAVEQGAIPIAIYQVEQPNYFAARATFSTALGLRPLMALVQSGWDENLISQPSGSYLIQTQLNAALPLPAREIKYQQQYFYNTNIYTGFEAGYQVVINPPSDAPLMNIKYPQMGIQWKLNGIDYQSSVDGIDTGILGYLFIVLSVVIIPLDFIFATNYPNILSTFGSSISWLSLFLGGILLLLLIAAIIRKVRANASN